MLKDVFGENVLDSVIIIIIKMISRAPIYRTRWVHRALYSNTNVTHAHRCTVACQTRG